MNRKLQILIVEDDERACIELKNALAEYDDMRLAAITNNSDDALELTKYHLPDLVILDLELHAGGGNGFMYLQELGKLTLTPMPFILVTTSNPSTVTHQIAKDLGADFTLTKTEEGYSATYVANMIHLMKDSILKAKKGSSTLNNAESPESLDRRLRKRILRELELIGINPKHSGHKYLTDAIALVYEKPEHNLCATLGKQYQKTPFSIERAMQNAINYAWNHTDIEELSAHFTARISSEKAVPTVTEFVYYYANKLQNDM